MSFDEKSETPQVQNSPVDEKSTEEDGIARREFLKIAGVSAGAVAASCQDVPRNLYPYIDPQNNALVGQSTYYASVCRECPAGCGLHVRVREGRAVKLEGNPQHPVNQGSLCARGQAGLLRTYSPYRVQRPFERASDDRQPLTLPEALGQVGRNLSGSGASETRPLRWTQALERVGQAIRESQERGQGRVLLWTGVENGTLGQLFENLTSAVSGRHITFDPHHPESMARAHELAYGRYDLPGFQLDGCDCVLALEADLFETYLSPVEIARQLIAKSRDEHRPPMIWAGARRGISGLLADHWVPIRPGTGGLLALALLREYFANRRDEATGTLRTILDLHSGENLAQRIGISEQDISELSQKLFRARNAVILPPGPLAGGAAGVAEQGAVLLLNHVLGAYGSSLNLGSSNALSSVTRTTDIRQAIEHMMDDNIDVLIIANQNPVFDLPGGLNLEEALDKVGLVVSITDRLDATAQLADLVLPASSPLESWGDYEPREGASGLMQPVMEPLYDSRMTGEILIGVARRAGLLEAVSPQARTFEVALRKRWAAEWGLSGREAEEQFREAQSRGGQFSPSAVEPITEFPREELLSAVESGFRNPPDRENNAIHLSVYAPVGSGMREFSSGPWLDELPEPTTASIWGAPAEIHPDLASRLGISQGETVEISTEEGQIRLPVVVRDSVQADTIAVPLGGRTGDPGAQWPEAPNREFSHELGNFRTNSPAILLASNALVEAVGVVRSGHVISASRANEQIEFFVETRTFDQHHRNIARAQNIDTHAHEHHISTDPVRTSFRHPNREFPDHRWGMAIDLDRCTGCSACIVACQAENNISVVGPEHVDYGREMAWLQMHIYWERDHADRAIPLLIPILCQHCLNAPCESVCPVYAPYQTPEGLNGQVYNRCVGTRFCANNCPYKVRKFNWYDWPRPEPTELMLNPDVTARSAGVMEKCTFCVQRIRDAKEAAKLEGRELLRDEVVPACVQTCPTSALVFGDLTDPDSAVSRLSQSERGYSLLGHIGTSPAITYLERVVRWRNS